MHWPSTSKRPLEEAAIVFVRVEADWISHFHENDPDWTAYDSVYDINEIASLEPN